MSNTSSQKSLYDPEEKPEDALWFLPPPPEDVAPTDPPWTIADREISGAAAWIDAEREHAVLLAGAAGAFGALKDRLRQLGQGARHRIALTQVAGFCWHLEGQLSSQQIALYLAAHLSRAGDAMPALARASWAVGRMTGSQRLTAGGLAGFLGRKVATHGQTSDHIERPQGDEFASLEARFWSQLSELGHCHPITCAAFAWDQWQKMDMSGEGARIEGAVVAARIGAQATSSTAHRSEASFLPFRATPRPGTVFDQLRWFYTGVENECLAALLTLDQITAWQSRAGDAAGHLSGKTPALILAALATWPMLSAEALATQTGASRAAVQRNIDRLHALGLLREITGQGRFRMWAAKV